MDDTANAAILRLTKELVWIEEMLAICESADARRGPSDGFADRVFANAMDVAIEAARSNYEKMMFRDALKSGFYDLQSARTRTASSAAAATNTCTRTSRCGSSR